MARSIARSVLAGAALGCLGLSGCAGTYDVLTSQRFKERPFHTIFTKQDPILVLETVQEGDERVRAMRNLREPKENGGTEVEQEKVIAILKVSATEDPRPFCRLAAIEALAKFKDPRANAILIASYTNAGYGATPPTGDVTPAGALAGVKVAAASFTPESVTTIQCRALNGLGMHRTPEGLRILVEAASAPAAKPKGGLEQAGFTLEAAARVSEPDRIDVRLAAIRGLAEYKKDPQAITVLVNVLKTEKDVALRGRCHESLIKITDQDLPMDGAAWAAWWERQPRTGTGTATPAPVSPASK